jgi:(p)ppGpp synthase/HD superfamily hydrolase
MDKHNRLAAISIVRQEMIGLRNDGKTPSWQHPYDVEEVVLQMIKDCPEGATHLLDSEIIHMQIVALLHDLLEDTAWKASAIKRMFNEDVMKDVQSLTKEYDCRFGTPQLVEYFNHLVTEASHFARIVKCCDRIANLKEARGVFTPYRLERYIFETKMLVIPIAMTVGISDFSDWLVMELERLSVADSERLSVADSE